MARPQAIQPVVDSGRYIRWLIHGDPGVGKTPFICELPKTLILDGEGGDSIVSAAIAGTTAHRWVMDDWAAMEEAYDFVKHDAAKEGFEWVWLDPLSHFQDNGLDDIMKQLVADPKKGHRKVYAPDKGEFGQNMNRISQWVRDMKGLPINFGLTSHTFRVEDERTGDVMYMPMVTGKGMATKISGYFGLVTYMDVEEGVARLRTKKSEEFYCRNRYGGLPDVILKPKATVIVQKITASRSTARPAAPAAKVGPRPRPVVRPVKKIGA